MNVPLILAVVFLLALLIESLVEYFVGTPMDHLPKLVPYKWCLAYIAAIVGLIGAFVYKLDLVNIIGSWLGSSIPVHPFGIVLTGLTIGRGSNFVHGVIMKFMKPVFPSA